jgi:beta-glucuronidase
VEDYARPFDAGRVGADEMIFMGGRKTIPLDGEWRFVPDLFDEGLRQRWYREPKGDPFGFDRPRDTDWSGEPMQVPSCWNLARPELHHFEGSGWYARDFAAPEVPPGGRCFLRVGAANYETRVFLNGRFAGGHRGGPTPFFVDLTPCLVPDTNTLCVQVENRREPFRVPMHHFDWFNYGGLYREVSLVVLPEAHLRDVRVWLVGPGLIGVRLQVSGEGIAKLRIPELGVYVELPITKGQAQATLAAEPDLWSPTLPRLYDVAVSYGTDRVRDRIGFRSLEIRKMQILLNGEPLWLRGVCCHEDDVHLGKATTDFDIRRRMDHVRDLGANAIRLTHYPHHERVAEIADEAGVLLIEEIPVYWAIEFENPDTLADARNQLREMIRRDANRASVIMWGIGNENADTDARLAFMSSLAATARSEDPTRLVTAACLIDRERFRVADRLAADLDVVGVNEYFGWYERDIARLGELLERTHLEQPLVISETGADAATGSHGRPGTLFTEGHQAWMLSEQIRIAAASPKISGIFPWLLYDYRTERRQTGLQRGWSRKGLIDRDKATKKEAFQAVCTRYSSL